MTSKIIVIGVNHDSAPVDVRERVAFAPEVVPEAISDLISSTQLEEGVILSTCNRTEIYGWFSQEDQAVAAGDDVIQWLAKFHGLSS